MTEAEEDALARRVLAGDADAFGTLVERHRRRAYVQALGIVGSREDALDLAQEAFVRAYRARHTLDPTRPFSAWLHQIVRRLCFNFLRDRRVRARVTEDGPDWLVVSVPDPRPDPAAAAERAERARRVAAAIDRLPAREREVLVLKEFEELTYREIAAMVGVPIGTVMSRLYSARRRLADVLEHERER